MHHGDYPKDTYAALKWKLAPKYFLSKNVVTPLLLFISFVKECLVEEVA